VDVAREKLAAEDKGTPRVDVDASAPRAAGASVPIAIAARNATPRAKILPPEKARGPPRSSARRERIGFASIERLRAGRGHAVRARARTSDLHAPFASVGLRDLPRDAPRRANKGLCQSRIFRRATAGTPRAASPNRRGRWTAHLSFKLGRSRG
jgi:hypothetical protein